MIWFWLGFLVLIGLFLAIDLGLFNRKTHVISVREALTWTAVWVTTSFAFAAFIYFAYEQHWFGIGVSQNPETPTLNGHQAAKLYIAGYLLEWMLSVDNLFVIAVILGYFKVPAKDQHRVLVWGILAAIVLRGVFIGAGTLVLERLHFLLYFLALGLLWIAWKMFRDDEDFNPSEHWVTRALYKTFRVTPEMHGPVFLKRLPAEDGTMQWWLTPLAAALVVVNVVDLIFAIDSIPAVFVLTQETFIVFTSNIFAVLGLRSMYFALSSLLGKFHYLKFALAAILGLIGLKMLCEPLIEKYVPAVNEHIITITLGFIVASLTTGVIASLVHARRHPEAEGSLAKEAADELDAARQSAE